jgi:hypothetical protein
MADTNRAHQRDYSMLLICAYDQGIDWMIVSDI